MIIKKNNKDNKKAINNIYNIYIFLNVVKQY